MQTPRVGRQRSSGEGRVVSCVAAEDSAGKICILALREDGSLWSLQKDLRAQATTGASADPASPQRVLDNITAVDAKANQFLAVRQDRSLSWCRNLHQYTQRGGGHGLLHDVLQDVMAASTGFYHCLAITRDGSLWAWGRNASSQLGDGSRCSQQEPVKVMEDVAVAAAGEQHSLAAKHDGSLWTWGRNAATQKVHTSPQRVMKQGVSAVAAGFDHSFAILGDGSLLAWGSNASGQLGDGTTVSRPHPVKVSDDMKAVTAGTRHSLALKTDGTLWSCGDKQGPSWVRVLDGVVAMHCTSSPLAVAARTDGSLWAWDKGTLPQQLPLEISSSPGSPVSPTSPLSPQRAESTLCNRCIAAEARAKQAEERLLRSQEKVMQMEEKLRQSEDRASHAETSYRHCQDRLGQVEERYRHGQDRVSQADERVRQADEGRRRAEEAIAWHMVATLHWPSHSVEFGTQPLPPESPVFALLSRLVRESCARHRRELRKPEFCPPPQLEVLRMDIILNPRLTRAYCSCKEHLEGLRRRSGCSPIPALANLKLPVQGLGSGIDLNEHLAFHGARRDTIQSICRSGFDPQRGGEAYGNMFGVATYLAVNASKSDIYTEEFSARLPRQAERQMIVARVALGEAFKAIHQMPQVHRPPDNHDSVWAVPREHGGAVDHIEIMVYRHDQVLPVAVVTYLHSAGCMCAECQKRPL